jgi:betaine-aldehyde dehydrogenase
VISQVANGTAEDIDIAVKAARACLNSPKWGYASTGKQRAVILRKLGVIVTQRKDELVRLDVLDQGKPIREAEADVNDVITSCEHFAYLAEEQDNRQYEVIENETEGDFVTHIVLEPIGVIGAITPWNYPLLMGVWKVLSFLLLFYPSFYNSIFYFSPSFYDSSFVCFFPSLLLFCYFMTFKTFFHLLIHIQIV